MKIIRLIFTLLVANLLVITSLFAQAPERVNYQAIARDLAGAPITNTVVTGSVAGLFSCIDWSTAAVTTRAVHVGHSVVHTAGWTDYIHPLFVEYYCNSELTLYCFEQDPVSET